MLQYPSIIGIAKSPLGLPCYAFYKYDGSNLRFEWSKKKGWNKFGSRTQMIDNRHEMLGQGVDLFLEKAADDVIMRMKDFHGKNFNNIEKITAFAEFFGQNSFAGTHVATDEKEIKLFDVHIGKKGFLTPSEFVDNFSETNYVAEVVYQGNLNQDFISKVRMNILERQLFEGVVVKGANTEKVAKYGTTWMTKIKTLSYLAKLKEKFSDDWEKYAE